MGNVIEFKKNDEQITEVIEVATSQLSEHSKQAEYSPPMSKKKWAEFVANIKGNGIRQPLVVTKGFRVIDGKHRLKAAKELGIESVRVIIEDIDENSIPSYITDTKLQRDDLTRGQKAAITIRLHFEEERQKAKERQGIRTDLSNNIPENFQEGSLGKEVAEILAEKVGMSPRTIYFLLAVYRNRPDLEEKVFNGEYTINKAYTQMKADEEPETVEEESPVKSIRDAIEQLIENDRTQPQYDETEHELSPRNRSVRLRKNALTVTAEVLDEVETLKKVDKDVRESARSQLMALARSCIIALGETAEDQDEQDLLFVSLEVLEKITK